MGLEGGQYLAFQLRDDYGSVGLEPELRRGNSRATQETFYYPCPKKFVRFLLQTPGLLEALLSGDFKAVRQILQSQQPSRTDLNKALLTAGVGERDAPEISAWLVASGAEIGCCNEYGSTPLHGAAGEGHVRVLRYLLRGGANWRAVNHRGQTPIDLAVQNKQLAVVEMLRDWERFPTETSGFQGILDQPVPNSAGYKE